MRIPPLSDRGVRPSNRDYSGAREASLGVADGVLAGESAVRNTDSAMLNVALMDSNRRSGDLSSDTGQGAGGDAYIV